MSRQPHRSVLFQYYILDNTRIDIYVTRVNHSVMKKKLTLTIDEEVTELAKRLAKRENTSVSEIVEQYLVERTSDESNWGPEKNSITASLLGSASLPKEQSQLSYKKIKESEILKKYGRKDSR